MKVRYRKYSNRKIWSYEKSKFINMEELISILNNDSSFKMVNAQGKDVTLDAYRSATVYAVKKMKTEDLKNILKNFKGIVNV